jgi:hypothetical protein
MLSPDTAPLFGSVAVEFVSAYPLENSTDRLNRRLDRSTLLWGLQSGAKEGMCGEVNEQRVYVARWVVGRYKSNHLSPHFVGRFSRRGDRCVLSGRFKIVWPARTYVLLLLLMLTAVLGAAAVFGWSIWQRGSPEGMFMIGIAAAIAILLVVLLRRRLNERWREDMPWLKRVIENTLHTQGDSSSKSRPIRTE